VHDGRLSERGLERHQIVPASVHATGLGTDGDPGGAIFDRLTERADAGHRTLLASRDEDALVAEPAEDGQAVAQIRLLLQAAGVDVGLDEGDFGFARDQQLEVLTRARGVALDHLLAGELLREVLGVDVAIGTAGDAAGDADRGFRDGRGGQHDGEDEGCGTEERSHSGLP